MSTPSFSLKDQLFNAQSVSMLAHEIAAARTDFETQTFIETVIAGFPERELKERIAWIREQLRVFLPTDYREAMTVILKALPAPCDPNLSDDDFGDFIYAPYSDFVAHYGNTAEHLDFSLSALEEITQRFSAEFALRYFLKTFPEQTLQRLKVWAHHGHYHVRRLVSEGTRPRLPWGVNVNLSWEQCEPMLTALHADSTRFVQRSVANHLNDWSKTEPERVIALLKSWQDKAQQTPKNLNFMIKHTLRSLIKAGHPDALTLMGYTPTPEVSVSNLAYTDTVPLGGVLEMSFTLTSHARQKLVVDYLLYYRNKKGEHAPKTYKIKQLNLAPGDSVTLSKRMPLSQRSTRTLYAGTHGFALQINGQLQEKHLFELTEI